jgi:hypothetical protein
MTVRSTDDSEQASFASAAPLLQLELVTSTLLSLPKSLRGLRPDLLVTTPVEEGRSGKSCKSNWQLPQISTTDTAFGKHFRQPRLKARSPLPSMYQGAYEGTRQIKMARASSMVCVDAYIVAVRTSMAPARGLGLHRTMN